MTMQVISKPSPKPLPPGGPKTNDVFEELYQHPKSAYSVSMAYMVALNAASEISMKGDKISWDSASSKWVLIRNPTGKKERKIFIQVVQVTHGGNIQFRVLDLASGFGWRSAYLPTGPLERSVEASERKHNEKING